NRSIISDIKSIRKLCVGDCGPRRTPISSIHTRLIAHGCRTISPKSPITLTVEERLALSARISCCVFVFAIVEKLWVDSKMSRQERAQNRIARKSEETEVTPANAGVDAARRIGDVHSNPSPDRTTDDLGRSDN